MNNIDIITCDCGVINADAVKRVRSAMPGGERFYDLANLCKMFADNTCVRIMGTLSVEMMCVCVLESRRLGEIGNGAQS